MPHDHKAGHTTAGHHYQECIDACFSCSEICNACSDDMIGMEGHGKKEVETLDGTVHSALPRLRRCLPLIRRPDEPEFFVCRTVLPSLRRGL